MTVLRFFINHPRMDLSHVGPVVDFLQHQQGPPQPEYSMKGRTLRSLLRQVDDWHEQLGKEATEPSLRWPRCKIREFEFIEGHEHLGNMRRWTITELLTNRELREEGGALHHCVATYGKMCAKRQTSIWSLRVENDQGRRPVLTIEVDFVRKMLCQARGLGNRMPKESELEIMRRWAMREGLRIAAHL